jgi:hypothetical protein
MKRFFAEAADVYRLAIAYGVIAWLLIQAGSPSTAFWLCNIARA